MASTTYSFADVTLVLYHPAIGQYIAQGAGLGTITVTPSTERTAHDVAADGSIMISKIEGNNGTIALQIQQTSGLNQWLLNAFNYLVAAPTNQWAQMSVTLRSVSMGDLLYATGVSFQQKATRPYQAQGQQITWNLMAADLNEMNVA